MFQQGYALHGTDESSRFIGLSHRLDGELVRPNPPMYLTSLRIFPPRVRNCRRSQTLRALT